MQHLQDQELSRYAIAAYTESVRIAGELINPGRPRLLDILNFPFRSFLELKEPAISFLDPQQSGQVIRRDNAVISTTSITFVLPLQEVTDGSPEMKVQKSHQPVMIYTPSYLVRGNFHLTELQNLPDYLEQQDQRFVAITEANAISIAHPRSKPISWDVILLNKGKIIAIHHPQLNSG